MLVQDWSAGMVHVEPVNPFEQIQRHESEIRTLAPPWEQGAVDVQAARLAGALEEPCLGRTIKVTGMMTAAAMRRMRMIVRRAKAQMGIPQHLRDPCLSYEVGDPGAAVRDLERPDLCFGDGHREPDLSPGGVAIEGEGNAARISEIDPGRDPRGERFLFALSFSSSMPKRPSRLAVLPRSRFDASLVALLISSGRLLELALTSFSLTASRLSLAGLFSPFPLIEAGVVLKAEGPLEPSAPPFSKPPSTCFTLGSSGVVGVLDPDVVTLPPLDVAALGRKGAGTAEGSSNRAYMLELSDSIPLG